MVSLVMIYLYTKNAGQLLDSIWKKDGMLNGSGILQIFHSLGEVDIEMVDFYPKCSLCGCDLLPGQLHYEVHRETNGRVRIHIGCYGKYRLKYKERP